MEAGDFLVCYTDGVTEAPNEKNQEFGMERLAEVVLAYKQATADDTVAAIEKAVDNFSPASKKFDDVTIIVIKRKLE